MRRFAAAVAFVLIATAALAASSIPSIDQILSMRSVSRPRISPDGRQVAYLVRETDWKGNAYVTQLWVANVESGAAIQLTRGKKSAEAPEWSPDGRWIAFLTEREPAAVEPEAKGEKKEEKKDASKPEARQIWVISPSGGEAWQLTKQPSKIGSFEWSKDSSKIAFSAPLPESKAAKNRKETYSEYEVFEEDFDESQLWTVDVRAAEKSGVPAEAAQITSDPKLNVGDFDWSPDGSVIAFSATANPLLAFGGTSDIYLADLAHANAIHRVVALDGPERRPVFSPDGRSIAFNTSLGERWFFYANDHIATVALSDVLERPATKPSDVHDLTGSFDEDAQLLDWTPGAIWFRASQKTATHLFRLDPATKAIARVTSPDAFYLNEASVSPDGRSLAWTAGDAAHMAEVFAGAAGSAGRKLTDMSAQLAGFRLGTAEVVSWKSSDGTTIEGILRKPADFDPSTKHPLLVVIHGGPTGVSRPTLSLNNYYPIEAFLARGAVVLEPNYRGSAGYGGAFRALNVRNLGVGDMADVMSGVDSLVARGIVDPSRMGSMGWSQGGYISAFLTTNTDRFKAISVGAGISDWTTYYVSTDITPFTRQYLQATPWDDPEIYAKTSPMTNIRKAKTPTLIQHGSADKRVPPPNSFELYRGLRDVGVPARLILYNGFGHPITKPKSNRAVLQHNLDWFNHYIWGDPIPPESPLRGSGSGE